MLQNLPFVKHGRLQSSERKLIGAFSCTGPRSHFLGLPHLATLLLQGRETVIRTQARILPPENVA